MPVVQFCSKNSRLVPYHRCGHFLSPSSFLLSLKAGVHVKAVLTSLNTAFLGHVLRNCKVKSLCL